MLSKVKSGAVAGIEGLIVDVEADISYGLPVFQIVGLPQAAVRESRERVKTAITNCGYQFPMDRVTINLAPADIKKTGTGLDLPLAVGILAASDIINPDMLDGYLFMGELSLDGRIKRVNGTLSVALAARRHGLKSIVVPFGNRHEAAVVKGIDVYGASHLNDIAAFFTGHRSLEKCRLDLDSLLDGQEHQPLENMADIHGQQHAKQALEIAAAGHHNLLMTGPPGSGKSMLARHIPSIMPPLSFDEALEVTQVYSVQGLNPKELPLITRRPFRAPHHTISDAGMVGGGPRPEPGEVSLAHFGVLFLDELPEFKKNVLEVLRQPLEDGRITIARAGQNAIFPSQIMLVGAMNPCPCGYFGDNVNTCTCSLTQISKYRARLSGPLLDRMDIHIDVPGIAFEELTRKTAGETSRQIRKRVEAARRIQAERFKSAFIFSNAQMTPAMIQDHCRLDSSSRALLSRASSKLGFSPRAIHSVLKVARTIADLEKNDRITSGHVARAVQYRTLDRNMAGP